MTERKKRLIITQLLIILLTVIIVFQFYFKNKTSKTILSERSVLKSNEQEDQNIESKNLFNNISYSGIDFSGNRYVLTAEKAYLDEKSEEIINMQNVEGTFYFKDETNLYIKSMTGIYNSQSLSMKFRKNVMANYLDKELFSSNADYDNEKSIIEIYGNVKVKGDDGNIEADKLLFNLADKNLNIISLEENLVNTNINLK